MTTNPQVYGLKMNKSRTRKTLYNMLNPNDISEIRKLQSVTIQSCHETKHLQS